MGAGSTEPTGSQPHQRLRVLGHFQGGLLGAQGHMIVAGTSSNLHQTDFAERDIVDMMQGAGSLSWGSPSQANGQCGLMVESGSGVSCALQPCTTLIGDGKCQRCMDEHRDSFTRSACKLSRHISCNGW